MEFNIKRKYQIALRRLYTTKCKNTKILQFIGCDKNYFITHINNFLIDDMCNNNFGNKWGLDHIVPITLFNIDNEDELKLAYNYLNIMPMFNYDNKVKGASIHFSIDKLNSLLLIYPNESVIINKLLDKCYQHLDLIYSKYLTKKPPSQSRQGGSI